MGWVPSPPRLAPCGHCGGQPVPALNLWGTRAQLRCACGVRGAWVDCHLTGPAVHAGYFGWPYGLIDLGPRPQE